MSEPVVGVPAAPAPVVGVPVTPAPAPPPTKSIPWGLIAAGVFFILFFVFLFLYLRPKLKKPKSRGSGSSDADPPRDLPPVADAPCDPGCKCYTDTAVNTANTSDKQYQELTLRDNTTFCGTMKDGVRIGCPAKCCTPACTK